MKEPAVRARSAAVEAEDELVQVGIEVLGLHCAVVCTQDPAFDERGDPVHAVSCESSAIRRRRMRPNPLGSSTSTAKASSALAVLFLPERRQLRSSRSVLAR
jgi:hypothetical protein